MLLSWLFIAGGLVYLVMGGDLLIRGSLSLARRFQIPPAVVGATIVAFGTSLPELVVSIMAATRGFGGLALGNVIGSNVANVLIVLGVPALISQITPDTSMRLHGGFMLLVSLVFVALCFTGSFGIVQGCILLVLLAASILATASGRLPVIDLSGEEARYERVLGLPESHGFAWFFICFGAVVMPIGADLVVDGATDLARRFSVSDAAIGATVIALGTSLPELSVSLMAVLHRQLGMAVGNVIGSNTLNILAVIGVTAVTVDIPVPPEILRFDIWALLGTAIVLAAFVFAGRPIGRVVGVVFVAGYAGFVWLALVL